MAFGNRQIEIHPSLEASHPRGQKVPVHQVDFHSLGTVNALALQALQPGFSVSMHVDDHPSCRLACLV